LVLEPFGTALGLGPSAGQLQVDALTRAGFKVDVVRDSAVSVQTILSLPTYSVVYMLTHSNYIPANGEAFVLTGEHLNDQTQKGPDVPLFQDGSLVLGSPINDPGHLYVAFQANLFTKHMNQFPDSSFLFMNGCSVLKSSIFTQAVLQRNVDTLMSWTEEAIDRDAESAADFILPKLGDGESVDSALSDTQAQLLDTSFTTDPTGATVVARLRYRGDGEDSFPKALAGATPTPTATPVPPTETPTPQPTSTPTATPTLSGPALLNVTISGGLRVNRDANLRVSVTDKLTSDPVSGAQVSLDGRKVGLPKVLNRNTGPKGQVVFKHLRPHNTGTMVVRISKLGFLAEKRSFKVRA
jgi:hypothetical protein